MSTRIITYGTLHVDVDCGRCGCPETIRIDIEQNDFLTDYDIDVTIYSNEVEEELYRNGWRRIDDKFVCADCAEELK